MSIGDRVFGLGGVTGATAELLILSAWAHTPATWNDEQAAGAGLASVTAMRGLDALGPSRGAPSSSRAPPEAWAARRSRSR